MLFQSVTILFALFGLASCQTNIEHVVQNNNQLVSTSETNFGISSSLLAGQLNWQTFSQNGDEIVVFETNSCSPRQISSAEANLMQIKNAKQQLRNLQQSSIATTYSLRGNSVSSTSFGNTGMSMFNLDSLSITKYTDDNFSVMQPNMENNLARVLVAGNMVTFVYLDGKVEMKPIACLEPNEKQLVESIKSAVKQGEEEMQNRQMQREQEEQMRQQQMWQQQQQMHYQQMQQQQQMQCQQMQQRQMLQQRLQMQQRQREQQMLQQMQMRQWQ